MAPSLQTELLPVAMTWAYRGLYGVAGLAAVGLGCLYFLQEKLIYVPRIPGVSNEMVYLPDRFGLSFKDVWLRTLDGLRLHAWFMWPAQWSEQPGGEATQLRERPTVLFFQENAGNMSWRLPFLKMLARHLNCSILAPSYRGYGESQGSPSERGLKLDAQAAFEYLQSQCGVDSQNIIVFGRSLGGAVTIDLLAQHASQIRGAIVENTFTSIQDVAPAVMPVLSPFIGPGRPLNFLIRNKWDSIAKIGKAADTPMLLLSSLKDEMLPPVQMRRLYEAVKASGSQSVVWVEFPDGTHMEAYDLCRAQYWPAIVAFVNSLYAEGKPASAIEGAAPAAEVTSS